MIYPLLRKFFFALDAETAHGIGMAGVDFVNAAGVSCLLARSLPADPVRVMGLDFPNPVGLAAGLDKNGEHVDALAALGFGFIEVGTVTPRPQPGNPRPRLFRLTDRQAIINRMGFNNDGVEKLLANVSAAKFARWGGVLGINIGKNFDTPIARAADDYLFCLDRVYSAASYVAVNISSPNTTNLRELQRDDALDALLGSLKEAQARLADQHGKYVPLALKIAPDLEDQQIQAIADLLRQHRMDGVIATNTTLSRAGVEGQRHADEAGGLSGAPLLAMSTAVVGKLATALAGEVPIIGVGGIIKGADAAAKIAAGASLVQFYTGFIYRGPELVAEAAAAIAGRRAG
ncbi:MAG: quinone-dependent dihydroorotate dehydrogenase [Candidatus Accumulibacter sp.]|uniref:quinone-dependent dihydroorotate dehydrogenase n=1 Tax=Accumulibacter sp. TaxID=2053492 RepID=UPI001A0A8EEF|nr:quinone-dependent dihydroorotate dehydrogenase [Accumulibacter sp.]MBE2260389.1 quinone-dependent dihydroorotate dehydrogenase [Paracoccaceae bacterium]MCB1942099.1 quinone-dependent dihydroorotate dehydrogenase [Accumulibacter sp.]MCP5248120.1 quinone-dependent dihydroorotate dehydrogenase [Accumulibacter sp.]